MSRYDDIMHQEFDNEDEDGQTKTVYACFGSAVYWAQVIEQQYIVMLILARFIKKKPKSLEQQHRIIKNIDRSRNTMGKYLGEVKQVHNLSDELIEELEEFLVQRKNLGVLPVGVHESFKILM